MFALFVILAVIAAVFFGIEAADRRTATPRRGWLLPAGLCILTVAIIVLGADLTNHNWVH